MSAQEQHILSRSDDAYAANERLAQAAEALHFVSRVPMFCECADPNCQALVLIGLARYQDVRRDPHLHLTAPQHRIPGAEPSERDAECWIQRRRNH